jgi:hypothetical protein
MSSNSGNRERVPQTAIGKCVTSCLESTVDVVDVGVRVSGYLFAGAAVVLITFVVYAYFTEVLPVLFVTAGMIHCFCYNIIDCCCLDYAVFRPQLILCRIVS